MFGSLTVPTNTAIAFICIFGSIIINTNGQRYYALEFTKAICRHNSSIIRAFECPLRNDSDHQYLIDARVELSATPTEDFYTRAILHVFRKNKPRITVYDLTLNGCEFLDVVHRHKVLTLFAKALKKSMNVLPKCPFSKNFNYTVTGLHYNIQDFPSYLPEAEFLSTLIFLYQNQEHAKSMYWGRVVQRVSKSNGENSKRSV